MTDEQLEQRLRAWYRSEVPADETAPIALRSALRTLPLESTGPMQRLLVRLGIVRHSWQVRRRFSTLSTVNRVAIAALVAALVVGGAYYLTRPTDKVANPSPTPTSSPSPDGVVAISPGPSSPAVRSTPAPTVAPCFTDTMQVLTGDAMRAQTGGVYPGEAMPGLGLGRGVFTGRVGPSFSGLWAIGPGDGPARAIGVVTPRPIVFDVVDLSPDGSEALLRAGSLTINGPGPECVDLYTIRTDGSGATRLTPFRGGRAVSGVAFSPDGKLVAYSWWGGAPSEPAGVTVLDIASGRTVTKPCRLNFGFGPDRIEWSPSSDRVAVLCFRTLTIFDASGTTEPVPFLWTEDVLTFGWQDASHLMVATTGNDIRSFDVELRESTQTGRFDDPDIELVVPSTGGFSPDGRWLAFLGGERGSQPGNEFKMVEYLVPASGGRPIRILNENEAGSTITWSTAGEIVAAHETGPLVDGGTQLMLGRLDPRTLQWSDLGPLLGGQAVWQIP